MTTSKLLTVAFGLLVPIGAAAGHGGNYRPPSDPNPRAPAGPNPAGPMTPGGGGGGGGPFTPGGGGIGADPTRWELWWEVHRQSFLQLKRSVHGDEAGAPAGDLTNARRQTRPLKRDLLDLQAFLHKTMLANGNRDVTTACLVALAKVGLDGEKFVLVDVLANRLKEHDQEVRETAAIALGITQQMTALPLLESLVRDDANGRRAVARSEVDDRVRAFAAYGMGLLAWSTDAVEPKQQVYAAMKSILESKELSSRNLKVAAVQALRILRCDPAASAAHKRLLWQVLGTLEKWFLADLGRGDQLLQSHVPTALARLLERIPGDDRERWKKLLLVELQAAKRRDVTIAQSCAIALGFLAAPAEAVAADAEYSKALLEVAKKHIDVQTRHFAWISLGRIGGVTNRGELLLALQKAKLLDLPWVALGLGVLAFNLDDPDAGVQAALAGSIAIDGDPSALGAVAIACGLAGAATASPNLRAGVVKLKRQDETVSHLCIALGMLGDALSRPLLESLIANSVRRPDIVRGASLGLARLVGPAASDLLLALLEGSDPSVVRLSGIAKALELVGDRRALTPLMAIAARASSPNLARAFAIAALGGLADKEEVPWNTKLAVGVNYTAAVETLTDGQSGILDIL